MNPTEIFAWIANPYNYFDPHAGGGTVTYILIRAFHMAGFGSNFLCNCVRFWRICDESCHISGLNSYIWVKFRYRNASNKRQGRFKLWALRGAFIRGGANRGRSLLNILSLSLRAISAKERVMFSYKKVHESTCECVHFEVSITIVIYKLREDGKIFCVSDCIF